jgi:hypothetical protein
MTGTGIREMRDPADPVNARGREIPVTEQVHPVWCHPRLCTVDYELGEGVGGEHVGEPDSIVTDCSGEARVRLGQRCTGEGRTDPVRVVLDTDTLHLSPLEVDQLAAALARKAAYLRQVALLS